MSISALTYMPLPAAVMPAMACASAGDGFLLAITSLQAYISSDKENVSSEFLPSAIAAGIVAKGLHDASRGEDETVQKILNENFSCLRLCLLTVLLPYIEKKTGMAFEVSQGEDSVLVMLKSGTLRVAPPKSQFSVPPIFQSTPAEAIARSAVESYVRQTASLSSACHRARGRSRFYATFLENIAGGFKILGLPESGWQRWAERLTEQVTNEIAGKKAEELKSGKRVWRMMLELYFEYGHELTPVQAREFVIRYYLMKKGEFDEIAMRIPEDFRDKAVLFAGKKLLDIDLRNVFVEWFERTANELAIASAAFEEAANFFRARINNERRKRFAERIMHEIMHSKASCRTGAQKMAMEAWKFFAGEISVERFKWDKIRIILANAWGVEEVTVDAAFHDVGEDLGYKAHVGAAILKRIAAHPSIGDSRAFIRNSAHKLRNALKESAEILAFLPGGSEIEHAKMASAITSAVSRHNKSGRFEKVEIGKVLAGLIGIDRLFADFSLRARIAVEKMGTALYFSNYYPHSHDLPQALIEDALFFVAGMEKDEWDRIESHKGRTKRYRGRVK